MGATAKRRSRKQKKKATGTAVAISMALTTNHRWGAAARDNAEKVE
jgi:hypothetical protein